MKPVYIGKTNRDNVLEICRVINSDIATGNAIVFNRNTKKFEEVTINEISRLNANLRKLAEDTQENDYIPLKFTKIDSNWYKVKIEVDSKVLTRVIDERIYKAIVNEMKIM